MDENLDCKNPGIGMQKVVDAIKDTNYDGDDGDDGDGDDDIIGGSLSSSSIESLFIKDDSLASSSIKSPVAAKGSYALSSIKTPVTTTLKSTTPKS